MKNKCLFIVGMLFSTIFLQGMLLRRLGRTGQPTLPRRNVPSRTFSTPAREELSSSEQPVTRRKQPSLVQLISQLKDLSSKERTFFKIRTPAEDNLLKEIGNRIQILTESDPVVQSMEKIYNKLMILSPEIQLNFLERLQYDLFDSLKNTEDDRDLNKRIEEELIKKLNSIFVTVYAQVLNSSTSSTNIESLLTLLLEYLKDFSVSSRIKIDPTMRLLGHTQVKLLGLEGTEKINQLLTKINQELDVQNMNLERDSFAESVKKSKTEATQSKKKIEKQLTWRERAVQLWNSWLGNPAPITTSQRDSFKEGQVRHYHSTPITQRKSSWGSWLPSLPRISLPNMFQQKTTAPVQTSLKKSSSYEEEEKQKINEIYKIANQFMVFISPSAQRTITAELKKLQNRELPPITVLINIMNLRLDTFGIIAGKTRDEIETIRKHVITTIYDGILLLMKYNTNNVHGLNDQINSYIGRTDGIIDYQLKQWQTTEDELRTYFSTQAKKTIGSSEGFVERSLTSEEVESAIKETLEHYSLSSKKLEQTRNYFKQKRQALESKPAEPTIAKE